MEGGKPENPEKNPRSTDENQQQTQPTGDAGSGNRTRAAAVGGERVIKVGGKLVGVANGKIRDSPRRRDPCLKIRDRDLKVLRKSEPETLYEKKISQRLHFAKFHTYVCSIRSIHLRACC